MGGSRGASVGEDGVFYLDRMFGTRKVEVFNIPLDWYVKSIQYEGKDITNTPTEFKGSRDPSLLEVVLSNRGGVVSGRVVDERGEPVRGSRVILLPRTRSSGTSARCLASTSRPVRASSSDRSVLGIISSSRSILRRLRPT